MIEPNILKLSIKRQCELLGFNRSSFYYKNKRNIEREVRKELLKQEIWNIYIKRPFYGYRRICEELKRKGYSIGRKLVRALMKLLGLKAVYPKPKLTKPSERDKKYPYLLDNIEISKPNQAWATDITYVKIRGSYCYLVGIIDLYSRKMLSWRLSNTMDKYFCLEVLKESILKHGKPDIFNMDHGCQFTSKEFTGRLKEKDIKISMTGKGRAKDNIFIERLWRSLKYEEVYLKDYDNMRECRLGISKYFRFYNEERFHQSLNYKTPDEIYFDNLKLEKVA